MGPERKGNGAVKIAGLVIPVGLLALFAGWFLKAAIASGAISTKVDGLERAVYAEMEPALKSVELGHQRTEAQFHEIMRRMDSVESGQQRTETQFQEIMRRLDQKQDK